MEYFSLIFSLTRFYFRIYSILASHRFGKCRHFTLTVNSFYFILPISQVIFLILIKSMSEKSYNAL